MLAAILSITVRAQIAAQDAKWNRGQMIEIKLSSYRRQIALFPPLTMYGGRRVPLLVSNKKAFVWDVDGMQVGHRYGWLR